MIKKIWNWLTSDRGDEWCWENDTIYLDFINKRRKQ